MIYNDDTEETTGIIREEKYGRLEITYVDIVRCKDCEWFHQAFKDKGRCIKHDNDYHDPDWFCADGKRKE